MDHGSMLHRQLSTLPLCRVFSASLAPARPAAWLQGAAASGRALPLCLARDLGLVLSVPRDELELRRDFPDVDGYVALLDRLLSHPLVRQLPSWRPPLSDAVVAVLVARLIEGLDLPAPFEVPPGAAGVVFARLLGGRLAAAGSQDVASAKAERPGWQDLLTSSSLARIEQNLNALDVEEVRFLVRYGAPLPGSPDPRELVEMLTLLALPTSARLALTQTLQLLPRLCGERTAGGLQTYPEGGYEGLSRRGSLDSLLSSELALPPALMLHRIANREALYYGRERPREPRRELAYVVAVWTRGLGGDGGVVAKALVLALAQVMRRRGYEVRCSVAGRQLEPPWRLERPGEVARLLHFRAEACADAGLVLSGVLGHLRGWRETYRGRQVLWVVPEHFDADEASQHRALYQALRTEAGQQTWYVRVGCDAGCPPATAGHLGRWQTVSTSGLVPERPEDRAPVRRFRPRPKAGDLWMDPVLGMEFSYIPPGTFQMGSPEDEEGRYSDEQLHRVTLTQGFWLARTSVTQGQYARFMDSGRHEGSDEWKRSGGERHPVAYVSWHDARAFCTWLSEATGEAMRLPTEAEWEYAARAEMASARYAEPLEDIGWYFDNSEGHTHPVGEKTPNGWGLYDMLGNVFDWVEDSVDSLGASPTYQQDVVDPVCQEGSGRVFRGGSFVNGARSCRAASRPASSPEFRDDFVGFRVLRT